jgi:hypothetical protein
MVGVLKPGDPVLITASDRLHRVGFIVSILGGDGVIVQPTAFDGSPLQTPAELRHSVLAANTVRLRDIPSGQVEGSVLLQQSGAGGVVASQIIGPTSNGRCTATVGLYASKRVVGARQSILLADWHSATHIADAIESHR